MKSNKQNSGRNSRPERQNFVVEQEGEKFDTIFSIQCIESFDAPMFVNIRVERESFLFEVDTGSPVTALSKQLFERSKNLRSIKIEQTNRRFKAFNGNSIVPLGLLHVNVQFEKFDKVLELFILPGDNDTPIKNVSS